MATPAHVFLSWLRGVHDVTPYWPEIDERARAMDVAWLEEVVRAMESPASGLEPWVVQSIRDRAEHGLALTSGASFARAAIAIAQLPRDVSSPAASQGSASAVTARLASAQSDETFAAVAHEGADDAVLEEWLVTWMHERVARGADLRAVPAAVALAARIAGREHPLGRLPLALTPIEAEVPTRLPRYSLGSTAIRRPGLPRASDATPPADEPPDAPAVELEDVTDPAEARTIASVVGAGSNWKVDARVVRAARLAERLGPKLLASLGLPCLSGALPEAIVTRHGPASAAFGALFSVGSSGGAYGGGRGAAWGRLAVWESLAALVGRAGEPALDAIASAVEASRFCLFDADCPWWYHVAWDLGVAARRPDGRTLAVLAATDTD